MAQGRPETGVKKAAAHRLRRFRMRAADIEPAPRPGKPAGGVAAPTCRDVDALSELNNVTHQIALNPDGKLLPV